MDRISDITSEYQESKPNFEDLREAGLVDISGGLPFSNQQELLDFLAESLMDQQIARYPIIGVNTENGEAVYILFRDNEEGKQRHLAMFEQLGMDYKNDEDMRRVTFTTSLEGFSSANPGTEDYIELTADAGAGDRVFYIPLGIGSDLNAENSKIPLFNNHGKEIIKSLFTEIGAEFI